MSTRTILLIRHAEAPGTGMDGAEQGVDEHGRPDRDALTPRGWQRAGALAVLFSGTVPGWPRPDALHACGSEAGHSRRPVQTLTPLARRLGLPLDASQHEGDESMLLRRATQGGDVVLICWRHGSLPRLARLVVGDRHGVPFAWPADRHDLVWRLVRGVGGVWRFEQRLQRLLDGDGQEPLR